ncbi:MAG: ATP-binding protein, partial [Aggregatilineales bacterium]
YPGDIVESDFQPEVIVDSFELFNDPVVPGAEESPLSEPIWMTDSITLTHDQSILTFEFAVLNYALDSRNQYRYRLEGLEDDWIETNSNRRFATYTNLAAGAYTFRVQGANRDGIWSDKEVALSLTVLPPWWETTWFRLLAGIAILAFILAAYQLRVRQIARHNRQLREEVNRQTKALKKRTQALQSSEIQLRHARDTAEMANRAKSAFLANMSHELRSPMNAILGFAQVTNRNHSLPGEVRENLRVISRSGEHLLDLINQVLDVSKIEADRMTLRNVNFDLHRLLTDVEDMFILAADDKYLSLELDCDEAVPQYINADMTRVRQTLINLMSNALKFTNEGGITLRVRRLDDTTLTDPGQIRLQFAVQDTGDGIAEDEMAQLFEAFAQTSTGIKAQQGTGLGLSISQGFVRLMGGDIQVSSVVGTGTTFTFDIVCKTATQPDISQTSQFENVIALAPDQPDYRILVVDDRLTNRTLIEKLLTPLNLVIEEAENGEEALALAESFKPHLIWMDIRMPVMDGMEATRRIRALPDGDAIKIIALTASVYDEERDDVIAAGCDDFVRKPVQVRTIFEVMHRHIGVEYVFVTPDDTTSQSEPDLLSPDEMRIALQQIPATLLNQLQEQTELGDMTLIEKTLTDFRTHNEALADSLQRLAKRFQFDEMLMLLKDND